MMSRSLLVFLAALSLSQASPQDAFVPHRRAVGWSSTGLAGLPHDVKIDDEPDTAKAPQVVVEQLRGGERPKQQPRQSRMPFASSAFCGEL